MSQAIKAVLVFDLDDTLYPEISYVHSGFRAVAAMAGPRLGVPPQTLAEDLVKEESLHGRGQVFDAVLRQYGRCTRALVTACVRAYRQHRPEISLYPDADRCLNRFAKWPLYIVTDGHKEVQARKVAALAIGDRVRHAYLTNRYGRHRAKPAPYCFELICRREGVTPGQVIYVGDNPSKDFVGLRPLGFRTVRILRGNYAHVTALPEHEAHRRIKNMDELTGEFVASLLSE